MSEGKEFGNSGGSKGKNQPEPIKTMPRGKQRENPPDDPCKSTTQVTFHIKNS